MRWQGRRESSNVEDRRGRAPVGRMGIGGGLGGLLLLLLFAFLTDQNPLDLLSSVDSTAPAPASTGVPASDESSRFMRVILADTEDTWTQVFRERGERYEPTTLVLFSDSTTSACGLGESATGPFYCPGDRNVYIDLTFFDELAQRFGAPGEFAQAYVVAHEVGHHIQTLTGVSAQVNRARQRASESEANALSVRQELQADCYAGVWGYAAGRKGMLDTRDVEDGLRAAAAIGDDRLQKQAGRRVVPESFTHGSSAQRVEWFRRGLESGRMDACDTFR
jgi:predicted metalloprotease